MRKLLFAFLILLLIPLPAHAVDNSPRLNQLITVFDNFQSVPAYWQACGDFDKEAAANPHYAGNASVIGDALAAQVKKEHADVPLSQIHTMVLQRRGRVLKELAAAFGAPGGCTSARAIAAQKAVALARNDPARMQAYIDTIK